MCCAMQAVQKKLMIVRTSVYEKLAAEDGQTQPPLYTNTLPTPALTRTLHPRLMSPAQIAAAGVQLPAVASRAGGGPSPVSSAGKTPVPAVSVVPLLPGLPSSKPTGQAGTLQGRASMKPGAVSRRQSMAATAAVAAGAVQDSDASACSPAPGQDAQGRPSTSPTEQPESSTSPQQSDTNPQQISHTASTRGHTPSDTHPTHSTLHIDTGRPHTAQQSSNTDRATSTQPALTTQASVRAPTDKDGAQHSDGHVSGSESEFESEYSGSESDGSGSSYSGSSGSYSGSGSYTDSEGSDGEGGRDSLQRQVQEEARRAAEAQALETLRQKQLKFLMDNYKLMNLPFQVRGHDISTQAESYLAAQ